MNIRIRKSDSLAYSTEFFRNSLEQMNKKWNQFADQVCKICPDTISHLTQLIESKVDVSKVKDLILKDLTELGRVLNSLEKINADRYNLLIEIEGLDFPPKSTKKLLSLSKEENVALSMLENFSSNLSKTVTFIDNEKSNYGLLRNSLQSFENSYKNYEELIILTNQFNFKLLEELEKEFNKAQKYLGKV